MHKVAECQCLPKGVKGAILDAKTDDNGKPIWECRNCSHATMRKTRQSVKRKEVFARLSESLNSIGKTV